MKGEVSLHYSGIQESDFDEILESISEYRKYKHYIAVNDIFTVALLLD